MIDGGGATLARRLERYRAAARTLGGPGRPAADRARRARSWPSAWRRPPTARSSRRAEGSIVRCEAPDPLDPGRSGAAGDAPRPAAAGRAARLPRHRDDRPGDGRRHGRLPDRPGLVGGRPVPPGPAAAARPCPRAGAADRAGGDDRPDAPGWSPTTAAASTGRCSWPATGWSRRAAPVHAGHLDLLPIVRRLFRHRMDDARLRTAEAQLLGLHRIGDVDGSEIPGRYLRGLGYHINKLLIKRPDISYSIYEPDLDMLYQFLSYQNITDFPKAKLERIINTENHKEIEAEIQSLYKTIDTKILVYTLPSCAKRYNKEEMIVMQTLKELMKNKRSSLATDFSFQERWTINSIKNFPKVLQTPNILHDIDKGSFEDKPAIIVAAGPSLNEEFDNLKYIKENGLAYIFSVGSAINALIEHGIYPDAACTYDPKESNQFVFDKLIERDINNIPLIFGSSVGFETLEDYPGKMLHMITSQDSITPYFIKNPQNINVILDAPSIAVITFQLLRILGCNQIILVGQNLAFQNNKRYASGIDYDFVENEISEKEKEDLITVKDVYGNDIQTNEGFNRMRQQLELYINIVPDLEVINTTKGGARIEGTVFINLSEVIERKLLAKNSVKSNWFKGEVSYDLLYVKHQVNKLQSEKHRLKKDINKAVQILREINKGVKRNQEKGLESKFVQFDKEFNGLRNNSFYGAFIEPMIRVHIKRLSEESQAVRFEKDLIKKGMDIAHMFGGFLIDCQAHIQVLEPYIQEMEEEIKKI